MKDIKAVAFDIDGTLYPNWRLYIRIGGYFLKNLKFFLAYNKVRDTLHRTAVLPDFFEFQARLLSHELKISVEEAHEKIDTIVYTGLKKYFPKVKPFKYIEECLQELKAHGLKLAILSDFPPEQKDNLWGFLPYFDVVLGSEACGALKPSIYTFGVLADKLELEPHEILYVGNSIRSDIKGANEAGMKSAYIMPLKRKIFNKKLKIADISFKTYRQLSKNVIQ